MKTLLYLCIAAAAAYAGIKFAYSVWPSPPDVAISEVPGLLNVCGDLYDREEQISRSDWWPNLVRHIKHEHPGYCLMTLQVVNLDHGTVIMYGVKSPDGTDFVNSSMEVKEIKNI